MNYPRIFINLFLVKALLILSISPAFSQERIYESFISLENSVFELEGSFEGGQFGAEIISGDFNNDNKDDLLVSAPFTSTDDAAWTGSVKLILGNNDEDSMIYFGENPGDQLGTSLTVGDFNDDGIDDFAIGAYKASLNDQRVGKTYIVYGKPDIDLQEIDFSENKADLEIYGESDGGGFGLSLSSFDVNNDGFDDLLVGAPFASSVNQFDSGLVYVYLGSKRGLSDTSTMMFLGQTMNESFGSSIEGGDLNGDGLNDVVISAYTANVGSLEQAGRVYIYFGGRDLKGTIKIPGQVINGKIQKGWLGFDLAIADLNLDNKDDLAISRFPYASNRNLANVSIYFGNKVINSDKIDILISEPMGEALLGSKILLEDLNADQIPDIILGAPGISKTKSIDEGDVYIIYSNENGFKSTYNVKNKEIDSFIHGENPDDWFGFSFEVLNINNDEFKDVAIGSRYSDTDESVNNGKVFVLYGDNDKFGRLMLDLSIEGEFVNRGELISVIMNAFELKKKKEAYLNECYSFIDFCLFNFMAMSSYDDINLSSPIKLYPDVDENHLNYEDINTATMLGIINGFMGEENSPFHPELNVSRVQALKIILAASELVPFKYRFELIEELGSEEALTSQKNPYLDVDSKISSMWWYPRYINFAYENNIINDAEYFMPDANITTEELIKWVSKTLKYLNIENEEIES